MIELSNEYAKFYLQNVKITKDPIAAALLCIARELNMVHNQLAACSSSIDDLSLHHNTAADGLYGIAAELRSIAVELREHK